MTNRLRAWGPAAVWAAVLFFLSAVPGKGHPPVFFPGEDKVAHVGLYALLGATLLWGRRGSPTPPATWVLVALGVLYGASDEWHQSLVVGRHASVADWVADTVGVILGYWITLKIVRRREPPVGARHPHESNPGQLPE